MDLKPFHTVEVGWRIKYIRKMNWKLMMSVRPPSPGVDKKLRKHVGRSHWMEIRLLSSFERT